MKKKMNEKNNLKIKIMRRVYGIWFVKKVLPYVAAEGLVFTGFLYLIGRNVYVAKVVQYAAQVLTANMAHPVAFLYFILDIFARTHFVVQVSVLGSLLMILFLFKNIITSAVQLAMARDETKLASPTF